MTRIVAGLVGSLLLIVSTAANAAELRVLASRAVWTVLQEIAPAYEKETGDKLELVTGLSRELLKRVNAGERFDVIAAPPAALDGLIKNGKVVASSKANLVRSALGVIIRAGAPKPDVSSVEAFKQTLLKAKSITYLPVPGVPQLLEQLDLKDQLASKTKVPETEISAEMVAKGEVDLAILVVTQAFTTPGVELAGALPKEIQHYSVFGAAISAASQARGPAQRLIDYLKSPRALDVIKAQGMEAMR